MTRYRWVLGLSLALALTAVAQLPDPLRLGHPVNVLRFPSS